jgi:HlyD family secretion protein
MMSRAVDACLAQIGLGNERPADRRPRIERTVDRPPASQPVRHMPSPATMHLPRVDRRNEPSIARPPKLRARPAPDAAPHSAAVDSLKRLAQQVAHDLARGEPRGPAGPDQRHATPVALPAPTPTLTGRAPANPLAAALAAGRSLVSTGGVLANDMRGATLATGVGRSLERELRKGLLVLAIGLGVGGGWAILVPLSAAVVVTGSLVVQSNVKKVQHPTGGVVAQIAVEDGMHVKAGDLLVRLNETQTRANLQMVAKELDDITLRIARLRAERDGLDEPMPAPELAGRTGDDDLAARIASETSLFKARASARQNQKDLLRSRVAQLGQQIEGLEAQIQSNASQHDLIGRELEGVQTLFDKRLAPITRLTSLQRDGARLDGERGQLQSSIAETKARIGEAQLQMIKVDEDFRAEVIKELRDAEAKKGEFAERRVAAQDQLDRIELRAPVSGIVNQLGVHTIGGVIAAGERIMDIVPDTDELQIEAHLPPQEIDQVRLGQTALVRFPAFNQRTTPQLTGAVSYVAADLTHDHDSNSSYYTIRATLPEEEHRRLQGLTLVSGMPAEIFVETGSRTMMSYLLKPITDQLRRAFNDR